MPWSQPRKRRPQGHTGRVPAGGRSLFTPIVRPSEGGVVVELPGQVAWDLPREAAVAFAEKILRLCRDRRGEAAARPPGPRESAPPPARGFQSPAFAPDPSIDPPFVPGSFPFRLEAATR